MKYLLFDIGNVLADFDEGHLLERVAGSTRFSREAVTARDHELDDLVEKGLISPMEYVERLNASKGLDWTRDRLTQVWSEVFTLNETGRALFEEAVGAGIPVCMLSNIAEFHVEAIRRNWPGFFDGAQELFFSYRIGVRKPDPAIYRHVLQTLNAEPGQCFFLDDLPENVDAACRLGMQAHRFFPEVADQLRAAAHAFMAG